MPSVESELDDNAYDEIVRLCESGDKLDSIGRYESAVEEYNKAWKLVPEPKNEWEASTWILAAIGDACFLLGKAKSARQALEFAMTCPGAIGNPFLHLRLGQVLLDAGEEDAAADELMRAYMWAGKEIFEKDDQRYLTFLESRARI
ncbi:tetratricopeptide repeat protein [Luteibacter aegosomatissinici]|uniref:tetratricopeptide repeat protein n=1 Tax=Luteibacter aegosomatissinici TaxID=2911539 RepID=UPI001FF87699|nr:tetratricopeptide repeat protein [Luteibacter aegosomatissinici]UPG96479.1 tetratricopeptide repeat protein [Luteibacter aegosomatissinici]